MLKIAEQNKDKTLEARAYAGLGHAARCSGDTMSAKAYHEKQLDNALQTKDKVGSEKMWFGFLDAVRWKRVNPFIISFFILKNLGFILFRKPAKQSNS